MFGLGGLVSESVNLVLKEIHGSPLFVIQSLVRSEDEESMASVCFIPGVITQFLYVNGLVDKENLSPK